MPWSPIPHCGRNPTVRDETGGLGPPARRAYASERNVAYGGNVNPPHNRKGGSGNPPPKGRRAPALSQPLLLLFTIISKALKKKDTVTLIGFGTFKVAQRMARKGINPQTGAEIKIKAKKVPRFVPGKALKDAVS